MNKYKKVLIILLVIAVFAAGIFWDILQKPELQKNAGQSNPNVTLGKAPDVVFERLDGQKLHLSQFKEQLVLINFWSSWCKPCIKEMPELLKLLDNIDNIVLIALSNDASKDDINKFLSEFQAREKRAFSHPRLYIAWDKNHDLSQDVFHTLRYPETIVITPQGDMVRKIIGGDFEWNSPQSIDYFNALAEKQ